MLIRKSIVHTSVLILTLIFISAQNTGAEENMDCYLIEGADIPSGTIFCESSEFKKDNKTQLPEGVNFIPIGNKLFLDAQKITPDILMENIELQQETEMCEDKPEEPNSDNELGHIECGSEKTGTYHVSANGDSGYYWKDSKEDAQKSAQSNCRYKLMQNADAAANPSCKDDCFWFFGSCDPYKKPSVIANASFSNLSCESRERKRRCSTVGSSTQFGQFLQLCTLLAGGAGSSDEWKCSTSCEGDVTVTHGCTTCYDGPPVGGHPYKGCQSTTSTADQTSTTMNSTASMAPAAGGEGSTTTNAPSMEAALNDASNSTRSSWQMPGDASGLFPGDILSDLPDSEPAGELPPFEPDPSIPLFNPPEPSGEWGFRYYSDYDETSNTTRQGVSFGNH